MKTPVEQITKQQNDELVIRLDRLEQQLNNTLELIDERFIDQLDKDDRDLTHQNHVLRQLEEIEFSIMETDKRLDIIDAENVFLSYDEKLRDVSIQVESLINQTESNDVADQLIDDKSRLLEDRITQNTRMIDKNRAEINSTANKQFELANRLSSFEAISENEISKINDINVTMIELQANFAKEVEKTTKTIDQLVKFNKETHPIMRNISKSLLHLAEQMLSNSTSLQSQIVSQKRSLKSFETKASESLTQLTDQFLILNNSVFDVFSNQSSTRKEDKTES